MKKDAILSLIFIKKLNARYTFMMRMLTLIIFICSHNVILGMKRPAHHHMQKKNPKKMRSDQQNNTEKLRPRHMHNVFATERQLTVNAQKKIHSSEIKQRTLALIKHLPRETKQEIAARIDSNTYSWWYLDKEKKNKHIIHGLCFDLHNNLAIGTNKSISIYSPSMEEIASIHDKMPHILTLAYSHDGTQLAYGHSDGMTILSTTDDKELKEVFSLKGIGAIWSIAFSPNDTHVALANAQTEENMLRVIKLTSQKIAFERKIDDDIYSLFYRTNDELVCGLANKKRLHVINVNNKKNKGNDLQFYHNSALWTAAQGENLLAIGYKNKQVEIVTPFKCIHSLFKLKSPVYSVALSNSSDYLAIGLEDGTVLLYQQYLPSATSAQKLLRSLLFLWLKTKKPDKRINTPELLLNAIIAQFNLYEQEVNSAWKTLPQPVSSHLWDRMDKLIKTHGK